jgi:carboxyl-terminal processing protease
MSKRIRDILIGIFIGILISVSLYIIPQAVSSDWGMGLPFTSQQLAIIKKVKIALETYQIDGDKAGKIDNDKMYYGAVKGLVASVGDPFTRFVDPKALADEQVEIEGEYGGLGIYITTKDGHTTVIAPIENTPADKAGVKPLDEIIKVDEKNVYGLPSDEVVKLLRGPANTEVKIWVRRKGKDALIPFTITREIIKIKSVRTEMIEDIAYIKLNQFNMKTDKEMEEAIKLANSKKAKGILLDLRNNPGGLLDTCINVASQFQNGGPVVGMRGRFEKANETIYADKGKSTTLPLVVLVNEGSASASEILPVITRHLVL